MKFFPDRIRRIGIAAPASMAEKSAVEAGIAFWREHGVECIPAPHLFSEAPFPYLSANDEFRAYDFNSLIRNSSVDAIQCVRGGYGSPKILDRIDWDTLRDRNLPVVGFSDITAIHMGMLAKKAGQPLASQMTARLPDAAENIPTFDGMRRAWSLLSFSDAHENSGERPAMGISLRILRAGTASGRVIPANLSLLASLCGTEYLPDFRDAILIVEDVGEKLRILDRHLTQIRLSGILSACSGVIFGQFTDCGEHSECERLFRSFLPAIRGPVLAGLSFGHELPSMSFLCGEPGSIRTDGVFRIQNISDMEHTI